ncbi:hypothetical protein Y1Q_0013599 [Alligator mississippiensis]|uniref:Uncharacterized protein n=1 Tax=Alligator mississippiensis TaxID=8496 RepID=A0A151P499_ALLMI|nr:hypothetical protein Y1Q_0013599 [Alligator mississippiensis]
MPSCPSATNLHTLCLPSILDWTTKFHMADEDEDIQYAMDTGVLWNYLQTVKNWFWACATSNDWWEWINMGI